MASRKQLIYWDSNAVISYFNADDERLPTLEAVLQAVSASADLRIVTSAIAKVEVAFTESEKRSGTTDADVEKRIDDFWMDASVIELVEVHDEIVSLARQLIRTGIPQGWSLQAADAIHLATAKWVGAVEIQTYDVARWKKYESVLGIPIHEPHVTQPRLPWT